MFALLCYDAQTLPHIKSMVTKHTFVLAFQLEVISLKNQIKRAFQV